MLTTDSSKRGLRDNGRSNTWPSQIGNRQSIIQLMYNLTMGPNPVMLDGKRLAKKVLDRCAGKVRRIRQKAGVTPGLATVLVGDDPASADYVRWKGRKCESVGMRSIRVELPANTTTEQLVAAIGQLSRDDSVHGILLQHPVPDHIDERAAFEAIVPTKDVDGVTVQSFGAVSFDLMGFGPCTPAGIMQLLAAHSVDPKGMHAVVIGRSPIVGKPMAMMLLAAHATVTICHSRTQNLPDTTRLADLVVAAVGKPKFVEGDWIKPGAIVIDAGWHPQAKVGDVDLEAVSTRASMITPVPGGVGPMTIATLIDQTATAAARQLDVDPVLHVSGSQPSGTIPQAPVT